MQVQTHTAMKPTTSKKKKPKAKRKRSAVKAAEVRHVVIHKSGSYDRLSLETVPAKEPGPGEVAIEVRAIGVNYADCVVRMGLYASAKELVGWPITPGFEVAGVVRATGEGVDDLPVGTRVLALTLFGGYASEVCAERHHVFAMPDTLSFEQAAAFPSVYLTAYYALHELAHPRPGQHMMVHSAAGGVGSCLVQLGKLAGCEVTGVVGASHKVETLQQLGVDHIIDKSSEDLWERAEAIEPDGYHVILDANGIGTLGDSYKHLRRTGKLVVYGFANMMPKTGGRPNYLKLAVDYLRTPRFNPLDLTNKSNSILAFNLSYLFDEVELLHEFMGALMGWLHEGKIKPPSTTSYPLERVADAHRDIESGQTVGKLVLIP
jgi:NADPH:quinone reductase-like Zn-dependent oxidoreductase